MSQTTANIGKQRNTKLNGTRTKISEYAGFKGIALLLVFGF